MKIVINHRNHNFIFNHSYVNFRHNRSNRKIIKLPKYQILQNNPCFQKYQIKLHKFNQIIKVVHQS